MQVKNENSKIINSPSCEGKLGSRIKTFLAINFLRLRSKWPYWPNWCAREFWKFILWFSNFSSGPDYIWPNLELLMFKKDSVNHLTPEIYRTNAKNITNKKKIDSGLKTKLMFYSEFILYLQNCSILTGLILLKDIGIFNRKEVNNFMSLCVGQNK